MAKDTWNYACENNKDNDAIPRNSRGGIAELESGSRTYPWTNTFTTIFSFYHRDLWSAPPPIIHGIFGVGKIGDAETGIGIKVEGDPMKLNIEAWDRNATAFRLQLDLGDENGVDWIQSNKFYQVGISISSSAISWAVNGVTAPKQTITTNSPGVLNLGGGVPTSFGRAIWGNSGANQVQAGWTFYQQDYTSLIQGASLWDSSYLDFSSAAVRARVWDENGDFINPGENGSLWLGDTYGETVPDFYFLGGHGRHDKGTWNFINNLDRDFKFHGGGGVGFGPAPGGLKKQYES